MLVNFTVELPVKIKKRAKWFLASCPILDVHSQGETEAKARNNLSEALSLFLISCFERGTLDEVLKECGFEPLHPPQATLTKQPALSKENYISVPIPFLINPKHTGC